MKKYYYTIGEVCNLLELKAHVLRYWEKEFPQLKPKKSKDRNRKYNPEDIELLKKIKYMLYTQKYTIEGACKKLNEMKKSKSQIVLDFTTDKREAKKNIILELKNIKKLLQE
ncbi:MAG: MerR family transcriptional regulator [Candidatus Cloacimonetes bacterium]|nr:MerR family transcriptional regulator [Candidatus Cloacimonadota bacterium]